MVMAFKDDIPETAGEGKQLRNLFGRSDKPVYASKSLDINQAAAKYSDMSTGESKLKKSLQSLRLTSDQTFGLELPEAAELVYPDLDQQIEKDLEQARGDKETGASSQGLKNKLKSYGEAFSGYFDRRAQAEWVSIPALVLAYPYSVVKMDQEGEHPGSGLAVPRPLRINSEPLISVLTGGAIQLSEKQLEKQREKQKKKEEREAMKHQFKAWLKTSKREIEDAKRIAKGKPPKGPWKEKPKQKGVVKRIMQGDVLYLAIVNLPTPEEAEESLASLERAVAERQSEGNPASS